MVHFIQQCLHELTQTETFLTKFTDEDPIHKASLFSNDYTIDVGDKLLEEDVASWQG